MRAESLRAYERSNAEELIRMLRSERISANLSFLNDKGTEMRNPCKSAVEFCRYGEGGRMSDLRRWKRWHLVTAAAAASDPRLGGERPALPEAGIPDPDFSRAAAHARREAYGR